MKVLEHLRRAASERVVAITPNPAVDRTLTLTRALGRGELNRATTVSERAGGKGINLARTARAFGAKVSILGFAGGQCGEKLRRFLEAEALDHFLLTVPGETRESHILLDGKGHPTEINEPGPTVGRHYWEELLWSLPSGLPVIAGSLPPGLDDAEVRQVLASLPIAPVVDGSGSLLRMALEVGAALIAPNSRELAQLAECVENGTRVAQSERNVPTSEINGTSLRPDEAIAQAGRIWGTFGVPVLLTLGNEGAAFVGSESWRAYGPRIDNANPIGSGDALLGAFLWALGRGASESDALKLGVAAGAVNAAGAGGGLVSASDVRRYAERVQLERIEPCNDST